MRFFEYSVSAHVSDLQGFCRFLYDPKTLKVTRRTSRLGTVGLLGESGRLSK